MSFPSWAAGRPSPARGRPARRGPAGRVQAAEPGGCLLSPRWLALFICLLPLYYFLQNNTFSERSAELCGSPWPLWRCLFHQALDGFASSARLRPDARPGTRGPLHLPPGLWCSKRLPPLSRGHLPRHREGSAGTWQGSGPGEAWALGWGLVRGRSCRDGLVGTQLDVPVHPAAPARLRHEHTRHEAEGRVRLGSLGPPWPFSAGCTSTTDTAPQGQ